MPEPEPQTVYGIGRVLLAGKFSRKCRNDFLGVHFLEAVRSKYPFSDDVALAKLCDVRRNFFTESITIQTAKSRHGQSCVRLQLWRRVLDRPGIPLVRSFLLAHGDIPTNSGPLPVTRGDFRRHLTEIVFGEVYETRDQFAREPRRRVTGVLSDERIKSLGEEV